MSILRLEIITTAGPVFSGDVHSVTAPGTDGQLTVLPSHAPFITSLNPGELKYSPADNNNTVITELTGGFLEVNRNKITVLVDGII